MTAGIPVVHASVFRFEGQLTVFKPFEGPCYRCLYPTPPPPELAPGCSVAGVLGVVPGIMGLLQANEALKLLLGIGETLAGRLLIFDALDGEFTELQLRRDPALPGLLRRGGRGARRRDAVAAAACRSRTRTPACSPSAAHDPRDRPLRPRSRRLGGRARARRASSTPSSRRPRPRRRSRRAGWSLGIRAGRRRWRGAPLCPVPERAGVAVPLLGAPR